MSTEKLLPPPSIHLSTLLIEDFRSCGRVEVPLRPHLTILAGENNGGKSNILEALRLLLAPADGRRVRYAELDDIRRDAPERRFRIRGTFSGLSDVQRGLFITALTDVAGSTATWGLTAKEERGRCRTEFWAGREGGEAEPEAREALRHVHLPALRDAGRALASGSPGRVERLLLQVVDGDRTKLDDLVKAAQAASGELEKHTVIADATRAVRGTLGPLTEGVREHDAALRFAASDLRSLSADLKFVLAQAGLELREISESGLGYANLLYIATVMVELQRAREADLTLFLVEEPEAHLHPQLQSAVLAFLEDKARNSARPSDAPDRPAGVIQVVVTTHSPQLATAGSCQDLVVVRQGPGGSSPDGQRREGVTSVVPIAILGIEDRTLAKIDRYLDVTCS